MNAHVLHKYLSDAPWIPTSLSKKSTDELREGLSFAGPIVTDDMQMGAITDLVSASDASVRAVRAGNSLLIYSNHKDRYSIRSVIEVNQKLESSIKAGELSPKLVTAQALIVRKFRESIIIPR